MALGSLPACAATLWLLGSWQAAGTGYEAVVMTTLGVALVATAGVTLLRPWLMTHRTLLAPLLAGSIPGLYVGTLWASRLRDDVLRPVIATFLLVLGLGFSLNELI